MVFTSHKRRPKNLAELTVVHAFGVVSRDIDFNRSTKINENQIVSIVGFVVVVVVVVVVAVAVVVVRACTHRQKNESVVTEETRRTFEWSALQFPQEKNERNKAIPGAHHKLKHIVHPSVDT